ncbi:hypothetical protein DES49_1434 [Halospina denitrificans]|uniref:Uncharacterized protein n=1 Tax=Halospina denitrificans TaxID=332522 RepID=A0A4R7JST9_9GAMM|nr:hypothetical protein [Halospina denitrificans]TDT41351.1 hypothetical protein DES49_1434 [Halospina denitrificans]
MSKAISGKFQNIDQARNVREDLMGSEIPQELIYIDEEEQMIRVMLPEEQSREVKEIYDRHGITY